MAFSGAELFLDWLVNFFTVVHQVFVSDSLFKVSFMNWRLLPLILRCTRAFITLYVLHPFLWAVSLARMSLVMVSVIQGSLSDLILIGWRGQCLSMMLFTVWWSASTLSWTSWAWNTVSHVSQAISARIRFLRCWVNFLLNIFEYLVDLTGWPSKSMQQWSLLANGASLVGV